MIDHDTIPREQTDGPSRACLSRLLVDTLRVARERGAALDHLRSKYAFVVNVCTEQGETIDKLRAQTERLREQNARLRDPRMERAA